MATVMDFSQRAVREFKTEKIRKIKIREIMNVQHNIVEVIEERWLRWFGHLKGVRSERIPKKIFLEWNSKGSRRKGKPIEQWMDGLRRCLIDIHLTEEGLRIKKELNFFVLMEYLLYYRKVFNKKLWCHIITTINIIIVIIIIIIIIIVLLLLLLNYYQ